MDEIEVFNLLFFFFKKNILKIWTFRLKLLRLVLFFFFKKKKYSPVELAACLVIMTLEVSPAGSVTLQQTRWPTVWSSLHTHGQLRYGHPVGQKNKITKNVIKIKKRGGYMCIYMGVPNPPIH